MINGKEVEKKQWFYLCNLINHPLSDDPVCWYERQMVSEIRPQGKTFGLEDWQTAGIYACLSPQLSWDRNVKLARQVLAHLHEFGTSAGLPITSYQKIKVDCFWIGVMPPKMGPKESSFYLDFLGFNYLPIDRVYMAAAEGKEPHEASGSLWPTTPKAWRLVVAIGENAAKVHDMKVSEHAWRIWVARQEARIYHRKLRLLSESVKEAARQYCTKGEDHGNGRISPTNEGVCPDQDRCG